MDIQFKRKDKKILDTGYWMLVAGCWLLVFKVMVISNVSEKSVMSLATDFSIRFAPVEMTIAKQALVHFTSRIKLIFRRNKGQLSINILSHEDHTIGFDTTQFSRSKVYKKTGPFTNNIFWFIVFGNA